MSKTKPAIFLIAVLSSLYSFAQTDTSELFRVLQTRDSLLFNIGFNTCDISHFERLISNSFEFYHDEAGITTSKQAFISDIRNAVCDSSRHPRRELIEGSLEVYPMKKGDHLYRAVQSGKHRFYALDKNGREQLTSTAQFMHIWLLEEGQWKLSRGISYNHINPTANHDSIDEQLLFKDKSETEKWLQQNNIPTLGVGYIRNGRIEEVQVFGSLNNGKSAPLNTIWNVASLTKPITAMVALKLVNLKQWDLDEPIYTYWLDPDIAHDPRSKKLTTRHILSHQTGFPNWRSAGGKLQFEFEPGTKYQYSGEGFEYLRKALEKKFNTTLSHLADSLIFTPLQMTNTRYYWDQQTDETRFAEWHNRYGSTYKTYKNLSANGADDLLTTIEDYSKFMLHILSGAGLSEELYTQMISSQVRLKSNKYWGLSWWVDENVSPGENAIICGGDDIGVHTFAIILPKSDQGLLIFTNCDNGTDIYIPTILHYLGAPGQGIIDIETK